MRRKLLFFIIAMLIIVHSGIGFIAYADNDKALGPAGMTKIEDADLSKHQLNSYAQHYLSLGEAKFEKKYGIDFLYTKGIKIQSELRFTDRFKDKVIGDIALGVSPEKVISTIGEPNLKSSTYKTEYGTDIIGYKTKDYYIIFHGTSKINEISVIRRSHMLQNYYNILEQFVNKYIQNSDTAYDDIQRFYEDYTQDGSKSHIRGGGWYLSYLFGINFSTFSGETEATIYNDFEGTYIISNNNVRIVFINEDSVFREQISYYEANSYYEECIKKEGKLSPNKKLLAYSDNEALYEHANILLRYLDNSKADKKISVGYFTDDLRWLNNRYIFFTAMQQGIYIYDTKNGRARELTKEFEKSKESFRSYEYKSLDSKYIKYFDKNNKPIILSYSFDKEGNIVIKRTK